MANSREIDFLILGAGWTSGFLIPQLEAAKIKYDATTTDGRDGTIKFVFDPDSDDVKPYEDLPRAHTVLITFPLKGKGQSSLINKLYRKTHGAMNLNWIQLGSTGIYTKPTWSDHESDYDVDNVRAIAEQELIELGGVVLNLAGLYGGSRDPKNWVTRVAKNKEQLKTKQALHLIHGEDVARAIVATHTRFIGGERWLITDMQVYDWYNLVYRWQDEVQKKNEGTELPYRQWVLELMEEEDIKALPRPAEKLGRCLDSRDFWKTMKVLPQKVLP